MRAVAGRVATVALKGNTPSALDASQSARTAHGRPFAFATAEEGGKTPRMHRESTAPTALATTGEGSLLVAGSVVLLALSLLLLL